MRVVFLHILLAFTGILPAQTFYEKIMEMNTANADTSNDIPTLERSAYAMERVSKGVKNNWPANYHIALCFVRITDLLLVKKDTLMAKMKQDMATLYLRRVDTMEASSVETKILSLYNKINLEREKKSDPRSIKLLEAQLEEYKNKEPENPRIYLVQAYFYKVFFGNKKTQRKKALELLAQAEKIFVVKNPKDLEPKWGKKWMGELKAELSAQPPKNK